MKSATDVEREQRPCDRDLEEVLRLAEEGIDDETKRFIDEVLKFIPVESPPEIEVFTSHRGSGDAR